MGTVGRLTYDGNLLLTGEIDERSPAITDGLVSHFPFDGRGGTFDRVGGLQPTQNLTKGVNLIEGMKMNWRDPNSWSSRSGMTYDASMDALRIVNYHNTHLRTPIIVDPNKTYQLSMDIMVESRPNNEYTYVGGNALNASGSRVTRNFDYTMASAYRPPIGEWVTIRLTRTGTSVAASGTSHSFNTVKGWRGDGTISDTLTKYYHFGGLFNYSSSGGVTYIRNLSVVIVDDDKSNVTILDDGIAVEEATTNLFSNGQLGNKAQGWTKNASDIQIENHFGFTRISTGATYSGIYQSIPMVSGRTYVISYWLRHVSGVNMHGGHINNGSGIKIRVDQGEWVSGTAITVPDDGEWHFLEEMFTATATGDATQYIQIGRGTNDTVVADILTDGVHGVQIEEKSFSTSYANGSRQAGRIDIPFDLKPPYSINLWHRSSKPLSEITSQATSPMILQMNGYHTNASISFWNYIKRLTVYIKGDNSSGWTTSGNHHTFSSSDWDDKEHMYTLVAVNNRTFRVYMDGKYLGQQTSTEDVTNISYISMGNTSMPNAKYRDLSMYDKALSNDEVEKLYKNSFSISKEGDISTVKVLEKPSGIPNDAIHIPLGSRIKDGSGTIKPASEANTVYENGAVWVGTTTRNEYSSPNFETSSSSGGWNHWGSAGHKGSYGQNTDRSLIFSPENNYSHWVENGAGATANYLLYQSPAFDGGYRSLQAIIRMSDGSPVTQGKVYPARNAANGGAPNGQWTSVERLGTSDWYLCKSEGMSQDGSNDLVGVYVTAGHKIFVDRMQLEQSHFSTPFTLSTRPTSDLEFNLHRDYQLDWSKDWSIVYWKKPIGTSNNSMSGYSIDSLGSNSNTLGGGYVWWGKNNGSNSNNRPSFNFSPQNYFGIWHMMSVVKKGSTITFTHHSPKTGVNAGTVSATFSNANYYVTQRGQGYDLKLGGWDDTQASNTWLRDLVIAKRAFTQEELTRMFKANMSNKTGILTVNNQIKEKKSL